MAGRDMTITGPTRSVPEWTNDLLTPDRRMPSGVMIDPTQFLSPDGARVTLTANAAQGATSLTVTALKALVPAGTSLDFGTTKFAVTTGDAIAGATTIAVRATPTAMVTGDTAVYAGKQRKRIPSGTAIGRTYTERDAGTGYGPIADNDDEVTIIPDDVDDANATAMVPALRPRAGTTIKENRLPGWSTMTSNQKAALRANFVTQLGV